MCWVAFKHQYIYAFHITAWQIPVEIHSQGGQEYFYFTWSLSLLLMTWRRKEIKLFSNNLVNGLIIHVIACDNDIFYWLTAVAKWVNSLWQSDAIWWHRSGSILAQVMACCLTTPSHYLNQCWFIISEVSWHSPKSNFTASAAAIILHV